MVRAGAPQRRAVHGRARHRDRERGPAVDQGRPGLLAGESAVGDQRIRALLRRLPAPRRPARRHPRPAAGLRRGSRPLHGRVVPRRDGLERGLADRGAGAAGAGRSCDLARRPLDPHDHVRRGEGAQRRARRLGRRRRLRRRSGRPARRGDHGHAQLGVDLLRQHPGRDRRTGARPDPARREPRRSREELRRPRRRARHGRPDGARLRDHGGERLRLGLGDHVGDLRRRACAPRCLRRLGAATSRAADALRDPPDEHDPGRQRRRLHSRNGDVRDVPDADALHAASARLLRR